MPSAKEMSDAKARRIAISIVMIVFFVLGLIVFLYVKRDLLPELELKNFSDLGVAVTAWIAFFAAILAAYQVYAQREVARQRTAFDFFFKTEMEEELWQLYQDSRPIFDRLRNGMPPAMRSKEYYMVRRYLNLHELMSVGIHQDVLDDDVCYAYWADVLVSDFRDASTLIARIRIDDGTEFTYQDVETTYKRWKLRRDRAVALR